VGSTVFESPICLVFWVLLSAICVPREQSGVYVVTNRRRTAYKFARPISTITWAVFLASPR
jgi:hypothetical protein